MSDQAYITKRTALVAAMLAGYESNKTLTNGVRDLLLADGSTDLASIVGPQRNIVTAINALGVALRAEQARVAALVPDDPIPNPPTDVHVSVSA